MTDISAQGLSSVRVWQLGDSPSKSSLNLMTEFKECLPGTPMLKSEEMLSNISLMLLITQVLCDSKIWFLGCSANPLETG